MSIADKLTYLQTTKQLLKTEINKINNVLDDNSTFRSYPQELFNGYLDILNNGTDTLWNNLEKVSATGEEATLENVETAPMKMVLSGNTSQDTTSGKNLTIFPYANNGNKNGITFTFNDDGSVLLNGKNNGNANSSYNLYNNSASPMVLEAGTYYILPPTNTTISYVMFDGTNYYNFSANTNYSRTFNSQVSIRIFYIQVGKGNETTFEDEILYPMLSKLPNQTIDDYEPYTGGQPSPSPDYPQQVKVVKGENVVSVQGKNLFKEWISASINPNTGEISATPRNLTDKILVKSNTTYTMWREDIGFGMYAIEFDKDDNYLATSVIVSADTTRTFTTNANTSYVRLYQYTPYSPTNKAQLEQNSTATPYVPYSKTDYPINLGDIELCKINTYKDYFHKDSGKWYVHKEIGKVVLDGTETWNLITGTDRRFYTSSSTPLAMVIEVVGGRKFGELVSNAFMCQKGYTSDLKMFLQVSNNNVNNLGFTDINSSFEDTSSVTTWLSSNNAIVYYVLATPTEEEITDETLLAQLEAISNAKSVKDKTYITQTNEELPFILDVEAIKEYEVN